MGYDIPGAIGVRLARPDDDGEVYVFLGDGNYLLHPMELKTAVQEGVKLTVILLQNDGFQSIHGHQKVLVGHSLGNEFRLRNDRNTGKLDDGEFVEIDYAKNAESIGLRAWNVTDEDQLKSALEEARAGAAFLHDRRADRALQPPAALGHLVGCLRRRSH